MHCNQVGATTFGYAEGAALPATRAPRLARAARKPELVLFEVAGNYDSTPLYQVHEMRFSDRMVAMMDAQSLWWGLRWLGGTDGLGVWHRVRLGEAEAVVGSVGEVVEWFRSNAIKLYPDSTFARKYARGFE